jgi:hypothetical protein
MPSVAIMDENDFVQPCSPGDNVIPLRALFLPRHHESLVRWLAASAPMGVSDAEVATGSAPASAVAAHPVEHVLVWVRESADPAYMIRPLGLRWAVIDHQRNYELGRHSSFEAALNAIRPVLPRPVFAA